MRREAAAAALAVVAATAACSASGASSGDAAPDGPRLSVTGAYVPEPPLDDMAAGYFTVANTGSEPDKLTSVTSDIAGDVSMHSTTPEGAMKEEKELPVPAGGKLELRTGGLHLMLMDLKRKPAVGDTVTFTLRFATSEPITVRAPVKPATHRNDHSHRNAH